MSWRQYQDDVATLFRSLGCKAEVNASVSGARATHLIDVWVMFDQWGMPLKLVVECKDWKSNIPKDVVLTVIQKVEDVGANGGIVVTNVGFQPAAKDAASRTNIRLSTFANLRQIAEPYLQRKMVDDLERRVDLMIRDIHSLYTTNSTSTGTMVSNPRPGIDGGMVLYQLGRLSVLESAIRDARMERFPIAYTLSPGNDNPVQAQDLGEFCRGATSVVTEIGSWIQTEKVSQGE